MLLFKPLSINFRDNLGICVLFFILIDMKWDGWDGTRLEVRDAFTGEILGFIGGAFTSDKEFSRERCYPPGSCLSVQPVGVKINHLATLLELAIS